MPAVATALVGLGVLCGPSARPAVAQSSVAADLFALLNQDRAAAGLAPLAWDARLAGVAESSSDAGCGFVVHGRAEDMVERNYFAHAILGCGGRSVFAMLGDAGIAYAKAGENIGWRAGSADPAAVAAAIDAQFMASPTHRANILDPAFTSAGLGAWWTAPGQVWTGGGTSQTGVVMVAEEFAALPVQPAAAPPAQPRAVVALPAAASHSAAPVRPAIVWPAVRASAPTPPPATPAPALPQTGVLDPPPAPAAPPETGVVALRATPLPATGVAPDVPAPALPLGGAVVVVGGAVLRRLVLRG